MRLRIDFLGLAVKGVARRLDGLQIATSAYDTLSREGVLYHVAPPSHS